MVVDYKYSIHTNYKEYHMFFYDKASRNHIAHSLLIILAMDATPQELQDCFDDGVQIQRPIPEVDIELLEKLSDPEIFYTTVGEIAHYYTFLQFFKSKNHC